VKLLHHYNLENNVFQVNNIFQIKKETFFHFTKHVSTFLCHLQLQMFDGCTFEFSLYIYGHVFFTFFPVTSAPQ